MLITARTLARIAGTGANDNMASTVNGLQMAGVGAGLEKPHRLAMFLGQLAHESAGWRYDREIWGPTSAQKRYDTRADLGNTPQADGDGFKYRGRGPIQITGKANYGRFSAWAKKMSNRAPDFVSDPDAANTDPWEGLGPIWYWDEGNPERRSLNGYADAGNYEMVTRRINGGLNGYADRQGRYGRAALVLMGRDPNDLRGYQKAKGLTIDGIIGPRTVSVMHADLVKMAPMRFTDASRRHARPTTTNPFAALLAFIASIFGGRK